MTSKTALKVFAGSIQPGNLDCCCELIEHLIVEKTAGMIHDLSIDVVEETVILNGKTDRYYHKQLATQSLMEKFSNVVLHNDIEVV